MVHDAVGPPAEDTPPTSASDPDPDACKDNRPPAVRASDTATETMLYRNWLRGVLGSADSETAQEVRPSALRREVAHLGRGRDDPRRTRPRRDAIITAKKQQWMKVAEQIKTEDPEAYEYLQGTKGMDRIGAGFIAMLAALLFAMFDLTASLLVLLGFLIFRWAVIAAPILGTVGLLRPASAGLPPAGERRGRGALQHRHLRHRRGDLPVRRRPDHEHAIAARLAPGGAGLLCGVVGWLLLRPYRRITQLGGSSSGSALLTARPLRRAGGLRSSERATPGHRRARRAAPTSTDRAGGTAGDSRSAPRIPPRSSGAEARGGGDPVRAETWRSPGRARVVAELRRLPAGRGAAPGDYRAEARYRSPPTEPSPRTEPRRSETWAERS